MYSTTNRYVCHLDIVHRCQVSHVIWNPSIWWVSNMMREFHAVLLYHYINPWIILHTVASTIFINTFIECAVHSTNRLFADFPVITRVNITRQCKTRPASTIFNHWMNWIICREVDYPHAMLNSRSLSAASRKSVKLRAVPYNVQQSAKISHPLDKTFSVYMYKMKRAQWLIYKTQPTP